MAENENAEVAEFNDLEFLNESFENMLRIAKSVVKTLKRPKDAEFAHQIIMKCEAYNKVKDIVILGHNNKFFGFFVKVLNWTALNQPENHYEKWVQLKMEQLYITNGSFIYLN